MRTAIAGMLLLLLATACATDGPSEADRGDRTRPEPNGVATMKPGEALDRLERAMEGISDVTYVGTGWPGRGWIRSLDVRFRVTATDDGRCDWKLRVGADGRLAVRLISDTIYTRLNGPAVDQAPIPDAMRPVLRGAWVETPAPPVLTRTCRLYRGPLPRMVELYRGRGTGDVRGEKARLFLLEGGGARIESWIATTGAPLLRRLVVEVGAQRQEMELRSYDDGVEVEVPPRSQVLRLPPQTAPV